MSDKRIIGVDIGTYAVKVVSLDPKGNDVDVQMFSRELVASPADAVDMTEERPSATPPPIPGADVAFDDEPTGVLPIPKGPSDEADETTERGEVGEAAASIEVDIDPMPAWVDALHRLHVRGDLDGALQATFVPDGEAMLIEVDVPFPDKAKVRNILPHLMMDRLPMQQSQITWDFRTYLPPGEEQARAMIGIAKNDALASTLEHFASAGLDPAQLGVAELHLAAVAAELLMQTETEVTAVVDLGHEFTRVAVLQGRTVLLARAIRSGGKAVTQSIADDFGEGWDKAEEVKHTYGAILSGSDAPSAEMKRLSDAITGGLAPVVRDLRRTFQGLFARKRIEIERVVICGGSSQLKNVERYLSEQLGIPVRRLVTTRAALGDAYASAAGVVALGSALTQRDESLRTAAVNLRTGQFAYRGKSSYLRRQLAFAAVAMVVLLGVLGVTLYMHKLSYEAQRDAMKSALQKQTKQLLGTEFTKKSDIQAAMDGEEGTSNSFIPTMSAYHMLHQITVKMPKDVNITLDKIEVDTYRNLILVDGETTDAQAVDRIVSELESGIDCLKEIKKERLKVKDDKADFSLQISSGCS